jgi:hypothetical protein
MLLRYMQEIVRNGFIAATLYIDDHRRSRHDASSL